MENFNFWDSEVWGSFNLVAILLTSLLLANSLKKLIPILKRSLIPSSVLGGLILLIISIIYETKTGNNLFNTSFFGNNGAATLEILTYHCLALGFIATSFKPASHKLGKQRTREIFDTGVSTVSTYLLQGVLGLGISILVACISGKLFPAAGVLLPFGYGQGTGQALNYGNIYENDFGFIGGRSFGLTIAALGFLSAAIGGVIHLNLLRRRHPEYNWNREERTANLKLDDIQTSDEIPMNGSIDKLTMQLILVFLAYLMAYGIMAILGKYVASLRSILFGFNFLIGVLMTELIVLINNFLMKKKIVKRQHINGFLMTRLSGFFFDIMIVAGVAAIRIKVLEDYWVLIIILGLVGAVSTYFYCQFISRTLFPSYSEEQFLATYGMLTGTASTGIILLRELDPDFETPASENLVLQNFPAMVFGFPIMLLAMMAPVKPVLTLIIIFAFFAVMNIILFRKQILAFIRKKKK
ncbi:MAG: sodium/glutamate symporter [Eubacteriales bacterium]|nr:sodium/glutamate symporter [Eubacteriales bacterium]